MKRTMKRMIALMLAFAMSAGLFAACSAENAVSDDGKISVVATIFPEYDWASNIIGDLKNNYDLTLLLDNGVDLHSYQPTTEDIMKISTCDLFIYVGGESDAWVSDALTEAVNKDMKVINLMDVLGSSVQEEKIVPGMQEETEDSEESQETNDIEYDEHVWLSLRNASVICGAIKDALCAVDPANADVYGSNCDSYRGKLEDLDSRYAESISADKFDTLVFADRFPFRYLTDDYNIKYYTAFVGCSAETEADFATVIFLAGKIDELGLGCIMTIDNSDGKIAQTVSENAGTKNLKILTLDSMQSTTSEDISSGTTYLSIMESNLAVLNEALN